ncbi:Carbohydrate sulfotransferase 11 [Eumeta japonica]|uniref:Carbohydrate sulfotransferase n=1 Tax=Eumeta variegata TaxID=151549 RepID=A0A4C1Y2F0_EUMVA|nr:Carbohydrate sulfotransferase 11 [Eumeta japonica]
MYTMKRIHLGSRQKALQCIKCSAKTGTFLFWATLYLLVMRLTIFKSHVKTKTEDWSAVPDNYTKWLGPVIGNDVPEIENGWSEPDNLTVAELEQRVGRVRRVCRARSLNGRPINSREFFVDHAHNLVWCNIFKAASSSWLYKFNILGGYEKKFLARTRHSPLTLARKKFPRPSEEELEDAVNTPGVVTLLVVREPFVRLLSAFRDKLENIGPPYYRRLARAIVAEHRERAKKIFGNVRSYGPTFYEFVAHLIKSHKDGRNAYDEHWAPYTEFCTPCSVNFTVIAKVETLARDSAYVIHELGLEHVLGRRVRDRRTRLRTVMNRSRDGKNTTALLKYYFSQLDREMLDDLLLIYGIDFEMFGYNSTLYRQYVRK